MPTTVIIGASRGLGYKFVKTLTSEGHTVIATARNVADLEASIRSDSVQNARVVHVDLTSPDSLAGAAGKYSLLTEGKTDHLLINGAYLSPTPGLNPTDFSNNPELFLSELHKSITANVAGPLFAINAFLPLSRTGDEKKVTYISTGVADIPETLNVQIPNSVPIAPGGVATATMTDMSAFSDDERINMQGMLARMMAKYPGWKGLISPKEAVRRILDVVKNLTLADSGKFLGQHHNVVVIDTEDLVL